MSLKILGMAKNVVGAIEDISRIAGVEPKTTKRMLVIVLIIALLIGFALPIKANQKIKLIRPFDDTKYEWSISGKYGVPRSQTMGGNEYAHTGIDYRLGKGTPLWASADGIVIHANDSETGYGNWVVIDHGYGITTVLAHLWRVDVEIGEYVKQKDIIGMVGQSGRATGPHAHFEVRVNNRPIHPAQFIF